MSYSKDQIERFFRLGEPLEKMFLRWFGKESFFDVGVQKSIEHLHPENKEYNTTLAMAIPIDVWGAADQFSICPCENHWNDLSPFATNFPLVVSDVLSAILKFRRDGPNYPDTLDSVVDWRNRRYLSEDEKRVYWNNGKLVQETVKSTPNERERVLRAIKAFENQSSNKITKAEQARRNKIRDEVEAAGGSLSYAKPIKSPIEIGAPDKWLDGNRTLSPEAYRQAVCIENKRRDKIMAHWAECWLAHLGTIPVTENRPKM